MCVLADQLSAACHGLVVTAKVGGPILSVRCDVSNSSRVGKLDGSGTTQLLNG